MLARRIMALFSDLLPVRQVERVRACDILDPKGLTVRDAVHDVRKGTWDYHEFMTMVIDMPGRQGVETLKNALAAYRARLLASVGRTRRHLGEFERRHGASTERLLTEMTAEDLRGGDLEYVEWAGEAKLLAGLEAELQDLDHVALQLR